MVLLISESCKKQVFIGAFSFYFLAKHHSEDLKFVVCLLFLL